MNPEEEAFIVDQVLHLTAEMEILKQVIPFLLAREFMKSGDPETMLRAFSDTLSTKISIAEAGQKRLIGEPMREALDTLVANTRALMGPVS